MSTRRCLIYRVEDSMGNGPYANWRKGGPIIAGSCGTGDHVCGQVPHQDELQEEGWLYGFRSGKDAHVWFRRYIKGLERAGFELAVYQADPDRVIDGHREVMFDPYTATRVDAYQLSVLEGM